MQDQDIRWEQRFQNYGRALNKLEEAAKYISDNFSSKAPEPLSDLIKQGLIQSFEYTHELAWKVMKDYAAYQGIAEIRGSRDAAREAFAMGLISDGDAWMEMIRSRNETSHTYNETTADTIFRNILKHYLPAFINFRNKMEEKSHPQTRSPFL